VQAALRAAPDFVTSLLSPAQIVLVLWLLAAAAPTAAALLDATLIPIPIAGEECAPEDVDLEPTPAEAHLWAAPAFFCSACTVDDAPLACSPDGFGPPLSVAFSVLHTAVQRHLPRLG
jgi:hypothetical protein